MEVNLPLIEEPTLILNKLLENTATGKHFRSNLNKYNSVFQVTSLGKEHNQTKQRFYTTFKTQGQCQQKIGGLLRFPKEKPKFIQVYFMGNTNEEARQRNKYVGGYLQMNIVTDELQEILHHIMPM